MMINDETLSAFLDHALNDADMAAVREALLADAALAARLDELAAVDALVKHHAHAIDAFPMPEAVTRLLQNTPAQTPTNKVTDISLWQRSRAAMYRPVAMAASVMLVIGIAATYLNKDSPLTDGGSPQVLALLETLPSGQVTNLDDSTQLLSNFSFRTPQGQYCRHYQISSNDSVSETIACRQPDGWQLMTSALTPTNSGNATYQPATGARLLDNALDDMMAGSALSATEETALIRSQWGSATP